MFRIHELKRLLKARTRALKNAEEVIMDLNNENKAVHEENKILRDENDELRDVIKNICKLSTCNKYDNKDVFFRKINELAADYQSNN